MKAINVLYNRKLRMGAIEKYGSGLRRVKEYLKVYPTVE